MDYLEAAWDGGVERVSHALRAEVHVDTTLAVSILVTLDILLLAYAYHTNSIPATRVVHIQLYLRWRHHIVSKFTAEQAILKGLLANCKEPSPQVTTVIESCKCLVTHNSQTEVLCYFI